VEQEYDIRQMTEKIRSLKQTATQLKALSNGIQAVDRNVDRILASVRVLELDIVDLTEILYEQP